jgi:uncharacterized protein YcbK (DUF882 family)
MIDLTNIKFFTLSEILNAGSIIYKESDIPVELHKNIRPTLLVIDKLREYYGKPIFLNCSYRSEIHNLRCGGATHSLHLVFNALDWTVTNKSDLGELYSILNKWDRSGYFTELGSNIMGLGNYVNRFIHLDTRGTIGKPSARWTG